MELEQLTIYILTTFGQQSFQKATFDFLSNFLRNCGQLFGKSRATFGNRNIALVQGKSTRLGL